MSLWVIKKRRMHLDPLLCCRGRPRHWIQTARELAGSPAPKNSQPTPGGAILQLLPPFTQGFGTGLGLRPRPIPGEGLTSELPGLTATRCILRRPSNIFRISGNAGFCARRFKAISRDATLHL